jgi:hypothetical protein
MKTYGGVEVCCHPSWLQHYMETIWQFHVTAALVPGKEHPVPTWQQPGRDPQPVWTLWSREKSYSVGNRIPALQPEACRYTDWAIPALKPRVAPVSSRRQAQKKRFFFFGFLHGLLFDLEDGSSTFVRNVSELLQEYTALHLRRQYSP